MTARANKNVFLFFFKKKKKLSNGQEMPGSNEEEWRAECILQHSFENNNASLASQTNNLIFISALSQILSKEWLKNMSAGFFFFNHHTEEGVKLLMKEKLANKAIYLYGSGNIYLLPVTHQGLLS